MLKRFIFLVVLIPAMLKAQPPSPVLSQSVKQSVIHQLEDHLMANYIFGDTAKKMSEYITHQLKAGVYDTIQDAVHFGKQLTDDLRGIYHDKHLAIKYSPSMEKTLSGPVTGSPAQKQEEAEEARTQNFGFVKAEILEGNIGYIKLNQFWDFSPESEKTAYAAMEFISHTRAVIVDLRDNGGGDPAMVQYLLGFLFAEPTHINDLYERRTGKLTTFMTRVDTSFTSLNHAALFVLTSKTTFSAAEEFAYDVQAQQRGKIIGEITGGGAHPLDFFMCGHGFVAAIPIQRAINPITRSNWEGTGVIPDIAVPPGQALEKACQMVAGKN